MQTTFVRDASTQRFCGRRWLGFCLAFLLACAQASVVHADAHRSQAAHVAAGDAALSRHHYRVAFREFNAAFYAHPGDAEQLNLIGYKIGHCYLHLGNPGYALAHFRLYRDSLLPGSKARDEVEALIRQLLDPRKGRPPEQRTPPFTPTPPGRPADPRVERHAAGYGSSVLGCQTTVAG